MVNDGPIEGPVVVTSGVQGCRDSQAAASIA